MLLLKQDPVDMKGIFTQGIDKEEIGGNNGGSKLEGLDGQVDRNPEKGGNMNKEDVQIFQQMFIVRVQNDFKTSYGCHNIQGKGGKLQQRIESRKQKNPGRQNIIPADGRHHFFSVRKIFRIVL
jgi:hypothetical protein